MLMVATAEVSAQATKRPILQRCDQLTKNTTVSIKSTEGDFKVKNNLPSMMLNHKGKLSYAGEYVLGLTALQKKTVINFQGEVWPDHPSGGECMAPSISIELIYDPMEVYIGSEFTPDTCIYNMVLDHEMEHVKLYRQSMKTTEDIIRRLLEQRFGGKTIYAPSGQARSLLASEIDQVWRPLIQSELAKVEIEQSKIDSDEEIIRLSWGCYGSVQNIFGSRFHY